MLTNEHNALPYMQSLAMCLNRLVHDGYSEDFQINGCELTALQHQLVYKPQEVQVMNFFRFEGASNPDDKAILYVIQTRDGIKGTLTDAYGLYSDARVSQFMQQVQSFGQKGQQN